MSWDVAQGDVIEVLRGYPDESMVACLCDPPYGLSFMNKNWDHGVPGVPYWAEVLRVMKPGGVLMAFGGSRTHHRLMVAIEDAGFEIFDCMMFLYGSGFPKSHDISKAIDKANGRRFEDRYALGQHIREQREAAGYSRAEINEWLNAVTKCEHFESISAGFARIPSMADWQILQRRLTLSDDWLSLIERAEAEREVVGKSEWSHQRGIPLPNTYNGERQHLDITAPATPDAATWSGYGTGLKPAWEIVVLCRKPRLTTYAATAVEHGSGALNIDAARIGMADQDWKEHRAKNPHDTSEYHKDGIFGHGAQQAYASAKGRWPANLMISHSPGCVRRGERRVKGNGAFPQTIKPDNHIRFRTAQKRPGRIEMTDADGLETIADWDCVPDCAVRLLGEQSGERKSGGAPGHRNAPKTSGIYGEFILRDETPTEPTTGTAARFFKNFDPPLRFDTSEQIVYNEAITERGMQSWENTDHPQSIPADRDTPPPRDTIASRSGTLKQSRPAASLPTYGNGSKPTGQSPKGSQSITLTETSKTTGSTTCSSSTQPPISDCMGDASCETACGGSHANDVEHSNPSRENTGISTDRDTQPTGDAKPVTSESLLRTNASDAERPLRFVYSAKSSRRERDSGLRDGERSGHPCVKPLAVTRYLATLLRPPEAYLDDATILIPFCGVASEMIGALLAGWRNIVGIELQQEYVDIAEARLEWWVKAMALTHETEPQAILAAMKGRDIDDPVQAPMFNGALT